MYNLSVMTIRHNIDHGPLEVEQKCYQSFSREMSSIVVCLVRKKVHLNMSMGNFVWPQIQDGRHDKTKQIERTEFFFTK